MALTRTAQQVIEVANEHESIDRDRALQLLNEAHVEILGRVHLVPDQTYIVDLVAGQQEYALPNDNIRVWDGAYFSASGSHTPLRATNVDTLYYDAGANWQLIPPGTPTRFYERGGNVGFHPAPDTTSVNGYPSVTLYYTQYVPLSFYDTLPLTITSMYPWVYKILVRHAGVSSPDKVAFYEARFEREMQELLRQIQGRLPRDKSHLGPKAPRLRRA